MRSVGFAFGRIHRINARDGITRVKRANHNDSCMIPNKRLFVSHRQLTLLSLSLSESAPGVEQEPYTIY